MSRSRWIVLAILILFTAVGVAHAQNWHHAQRPGNGDLAHSSGSSHGGGNDDDDEDEDSDLPSEIAGAWIGVGSFTVDLDGDGVGDTPPVPLNDVHTFEVGGSHLATNPANPNLGHGTWVQTGRREISARDIVYINGEDGTLAFIAVIPFTLYFDEEFENATTSFGAIGYLPTQDPLDPTEIPLFMTIGYHDSFRKVSATE